MPNKGTQASSLQGLSEAEIVKKIGTLCTEDMKKSGILASVTVAQFILESFYGKTELALHANNCFGMKRSLSSNTWGGSTWDGVSIYTKNTMEDDGRGHLYTITADFRKYPCIEDSIADHSAYLLGAKNGSVLRYAGLKGCADYRKAIQIIKDGGYATDTKYVSKICSIIERWNLTQYDVKAEKTIADRQIIDITKANLPQVPASRGSNRSNSLWFITLACQTRIIRICTVAGLVVTTTSSVTDRCTKRLIPGLRLSGIAVAACRDPAGMPSTGYARTTTASG